MTPRQQLRSPCFSAGSSQGAVMTVSAGQNSARPCRGPGAARSFDPGAQARPFWRPGACPEPGPALPLPRPFSRPLRPVFGPGSGLGGVLGLLDCCPVARGLLCDQGRVQLAPVCRLPGQKLPLCVVVVNRLLPLLFPLFFLIAIEAQALAHRQLRWHRPEIGRLSPGIHGRVQRPHGHVLGVRALLAAQQAAEGLGHGLMEVVLQGRQRGAVAHQLRAGQPAALVPCRNQHL